MSEFIITCPNCGQEYRLSNIQGLIKAECEKCGEVFIVEQPYAIVEPKHVKVEERVVTVRTEDKRVNEIAEELKKVKKDTGVVAFVCWPIAISMVLGIIGLIIKGLIIAGAASGSDDALGAAFVLVAIVVFFIILSFIAAFSDEAPEVKHIKKDNDDNDELWPKYDEYYYRR